MGEAFNRSENYIKTLVQPIDAVYAEHETLASLHRFCESLTDAAPSPTPPFTAIHQELSLVVDSSFTVEACEKKVYFHEFKVTRGE